MFREERIADRRNRVKERIAQLREGELSGVQPTAKVRRTSLESPTELIDSS